MCRSRSPGRCMAVTIPKVRMRMGSQADSHSTSAPWFATDAEFVQPALWRDRCRWSSLAVALRWWFIVYLVSWLNGVLAQRISSRCGPRHALFRMEIAGACDSHSRNPRLLKNSHSGVATTLQFGWRSHFLWHGGRSHSHSRLPEIYRRLLHGRRGVSYGRGAACGATIASERA